MNQKKACAVMVALACILVAGFTAANCEWNALTSWDIQVKNAFDSHRLLMLIPIFQTITMVGTLAFMILMLLIFSLWLASKKQTISLFFLWVTFAGAEITTWTAKYVIGRPRPAFLNGITEQNPSFPSGHATAVVAGVGYMTYLLMKNTQTYVSRIALAGAAILIITTVSISRLYLGLHYLSDVLAGLYVGSMWVAAGIILSENRTTRVV